MEQFSICSSDSIWGDERSNGERSNAIIYDFESTSECYRNSMDYNCNEFEDLQRESLQHNVKQSGDHDLKEYYPSANNIRAEYTKRHPGFPKEQCFQVCFFLSANQSDVNCVKLG